MIRRSVFVGMLAAAGIAGSALGNGTDIDTTFNSISPSVPFGWTFNGGTNTNFDDAGCFNFTRTGGSYTGVSGNYSSFCLELTQSLTEGVNYNYKIVTPAQAPNANTPPFTNPLGAAGEQLMSELFGTFYGSLNLLSAQDCAAFQIAVWHIVYDRDDLTVIDPADSFQIFSTPAVLAQAQFYLCLLYTSPSPRD